MAQKGATRRAGVFGRESDEKKPGDQVPRGVASHSCSFR